VRVNNELLQELYEMHEVIVWAKFSSH